MRSKPDYEPKPQVTIICENGYLTLHPTLGWRSVSARRLEARHRMAVMLDNYVAPRRKKTKRNYRGKLPAVPPATETRQQRRAALRGYRVDA